MWLRGIALIGIIFLSTPFGSCEALAASYPPSTSSASGEAAQTLGSIGDYLGKDPNELPPSFEGLLGIEVFETRAGVTSGQSVDGIGVISVAESSPADAAGLRSARPTPLAAAEQMGVGVLAVGTIVAFPPALFGVGLIPKLNFAKTYDVIVAVDSARTRSVHELEAAFRRAHAGQPIYLTIIRGGRRRQLRMMTPEGFNSVP